VEKTIIIIIIIIAATLNLCASWLTGDARCSNIISVQMLVQVLIVWLYHKCEGSGGSSLFNPTFLDL
jgi:hypothetical protein